jgi:hypothetical protein
MSMKSEKMTDHILKIIKWLSHATRHNKIRKL